MSHAELKDGFVRVYFANDRGYGDFHARWLRHNCDRDLHPTTRERMLCSSELPDDLRASEARVEGDALIVRWAGDDVPSRFALGWLEEHAYARDRKEPFVPNDVSAITIDDASLDLHARVRAAIALVGSHGAAVVRRSSREKDAPETVTEAIASAFASAGLVIIPTHFGRIEDLRTDNVTNQNTDQLGYTDAPVDLHTDQPFLEKPPRMQLLQCIRPADAGGDNYLVDALAASRALASLDRAAYEILTSTTVRFHRKQKGFEKILDTPLLSGEGPDDFQVRWSYFTMAPHKLPFERMEAWYRAHDRFARLVRDPKNQLRFALAAGDWVLYDNHRMMHARTGFRGARWLRGVYFDRQGSSTS